MAHLHRLIIFIYCYNSQYALVSRVFTHLLCLRQTAYRRVFVGLDSSAKPGSLSSYHSLLSNATRFNSTHSSLFAIKTPVRLSVCLSVWGVSL